MPIYAYRCDACGHTQEILQKLSDAPLEICPACHANSFKKQLTAADFHLKGSGWYASDFKNNTAATACPAASTAKDAPAAPCSGCPASQA